MLSLDQSKDTIDTPTLTTTSNNKGQRTQKSSLFARLVIVFIRAYKLFISPLLGPRCRFYPSCSSYAVSAFKQHRFLKACWLSIRRISKCHPGNPGGVDELPPATKQTCNH